MNQTHLKHVSQHFDLGTPTQAPTRVHGGLLHIMWRLDTDKGSYAIKQLSKDIDLKNERVIKNYELSEKIASRFSALGIPAVPAIENTGQYLFMIEETGFLVYPWVDAKALDQHAVSEHHALKIATILEKMHCLNLDEPEITQPEFYTHTDQKILELIDKAESFNCPFAADLRKNQKNILAANESYQNAIPTLKTHIIVSHGDLDQKNVLWDSSNNPILIDWEAACKIDPTYDIIGTAFNWSGITSSFDKDLFFKMIEAYQKAGGVINKEYVVAACYGSFSWIGWLVYNIERSCVSDDSEHKNVGIEQVNQTLATILRLQRLMPEVIKIIEGNMTNTHQPFNIIPDLARKLIAEQFLEYAHLPITSVEKQGHDNRTYRLGNDMLIRMPTAESYALKVPKEQALLPKLVPHLTISIPVPIKMGAASVDYPYPFSIYKWLPGKSINLLVLDDDVRQQLAVDLAKFLKELQSIHDVEGPPPGQHNWWRGDHVSVYDKGAREQIAELSTVINVASAIDLWERACKTRWDQPPVWIHGDFAIGNMLLLDGKLSALIDFGGIALGDPACDLVVAWTFLKNNARDIFIREMALDEDTWLRAKAWALWKATFELCQITDKNSPGALIQKRIIEDVIYG